MNTEFARRQMIEQQIRSWHVSNQAVLDTLDELPRHRFVPPLYRHLAYADTEIPLSHGQKMMTPILEGNLLQLLELDARQRVLEIGTGSGFVTACLARLTESVTSIEIFEDLLEAARDSLDEAGVSNTTLLAMDAMAELPGGPFDAIAVTASMPRFDERLLGVLNPGGRIFAVVGEGPVMEATLITGGDNSQTERRSLFETRVAPLINAAATPVFQF